eukprot:Plantae.Rhodophyta-Palmaria_palmata.ctg13671.p1 GENE.Plantae.Rhodophyta-Palmaria_palmata.ctg13671~~Plantae.Rhodophyta-Palmaria_palmata.ctg13671.p1  ORF type:complete len:158 (-),score=34.70 Plantae.Rhodophyta-Palmaria_palmata.ctg13671:60-533(-)
MPDFEKEFHEIWKKWIKYAKKLDWKAEFPKDETGYGIDKDVRSVKVLEHLMSLNIGKLYKRMEKEQLFGFLPVMARSSRFNIGALGAESFCERVISAGNIVMTDGNTLLSSKELDMLVTLRMNREYMIWARDAFPNLKIGSYSSAMIPEAENVEDNV